MERLPCLLHSITDWMIRLRLLLKESNFSTIISVNAPTMTGSDETRSKCYEEPPALLASAAVTNLPADEC
nr:unnamed protein product [Spirometra erinaceieuropaei]